MRLDGYIRVSKVGGRKGESFISPAEQRKAIEAYAAAHGLELAEWHEDLDQSGGTLDRPAFNEALERCRTGETGGIIAAKLDRLTRSTVGLGTLIDQARAGGWNLVAVDFGLDLFTANGKLVADVLAAVAEWERTRRTDDWAAARRNAVERGVPNGRAPLGYGKRPDGRFEIVEGEARKVREAFRLRADGVPFAQIGRPYGWSHSTVRQMLGNEAYLGVARAGEFVNENAHPPIVSRAEFDGAQPGRRTTAAPAGETTRDRLFVGLARCGGCGRTLKVVRRKRADNSYAVSYFCKDAASAACPSRAFVRADDLDGFVADWFAAAIKDVPRMVDVVAAGRDLEDAQAAQALAESELAAFVDTAAALDRAMFQRGIDARQARLEDAREKVGQLSARLTRLPAGGSLSKLWGDFDAQGRRTVLGSFVDRVEVSRGAADDLAGNVRIIWTDGTVAEHETRTRVKAA